MKLVALRRNRRRQVSARALAGDRPSALTIIGNTGDDLEIWGLYVSPISTPSATRWPAD